MLPTVECCQTGRSISVWDTVAKQRTFICHRDGAVEVLLLHIPGCVIHLISDATETAAVNFDSCKLKKKQCILDTQLYFFTGNNGALHFFKKYSLGSRPEKRPASAASNILLHLQMFVFFYSCEAARRVPEGSSGENYSESKNQSRAESPKNQEIQPWGRLTTVWPTSSHLSAPAQAGGIESVRTDSQQPPPLLL